MYLGIDGGGSRLRLLLTDADLRVVRYVEGGGVNTNFVPAREVRRVMEQALDACLPSGTELEGVAMMVLGEAATLTHLLEDRATVRHRMALSEAEMGLMAGLAQTRGFLALSGTGSDVFFMDGETQEVVGGWGLLLGDEGSGTDIGQMGLRAAIRAHEGWGEETLLLDMLLDRWGVQRTSLMRQMCEKVYAVPNPRSVVASFARITGEAARLGDPVAIGICRTAGHSMALQMAALMKRVSTTVPDLSGYDITLSGGSWKGSRHMFQGFESTLRVSHPAVRIIWPAYEPVAGAVACLAAASGMDREVLRCRMAEHLGEFRYGLPEDWVMPPVPA